MTAYALVLNGGSSSLKFRVYDCRDGADWTVAARGAIDDIGAAAPRFEAYDGTGAKLVDRTTAAVRDMGGAVELVARWLSDRYGAASIAAVGHRVVHGGTKYAKPVVVTPEVIDDLRALVPLAPLHEPQAIAAIESISAQLPHVPQVASFDTAFHRTMPPLAQLVALPEDIRARGVQRYGFHGLSYRYIASVLPHVAPEIADGRVIVAHLGNGASLCAMRSRRSIDCTFGFTPLDGLCMGTRPGSTDPGVVLYLMQELRMTAAEIEDLLYRRSGLAGLSGISNDMRELEASADPRAKQAVGYFVFKAAKHIGALAAVLAGIDAIVFTAGIGEHSSEARRRICEASAWLGIEIDLSANERHATRISKDGSRVSAWIIPTDEELMIARDIREVLPGAGS